MSKKFTIYGTDGSVQFVMPVPIQAQRAPSTSDVNFSQGQAWFDNSQNPPIEYTYNGAGIWNQGANAYATTTTPGIVTLSNDMSADSASLTKVPAVKTVKDYVDGIAISGSPVATETTAGIGELASDAEAIAGTPSTGLLALFVTPSNLAPVLASPSDIGSSAPADGTFVNLTADGNGAVSLGANAASDFTVTGAFDLTLATTLGSIPISAGEAAADAISLQSSSGGLDVDAALQINIASSQNAVDAIRIISSAGGIDIDAVGAATEDINITNTGGSIVLVATENAADSIVISSSVGGIDITAAGASAGEDIDITATGSSINLVATENAAQTIYLHANGGASETIELRADQGTGAASVAVTSDVGGITLTGGLGTADAINIVASDTAGGIDIDSGTGGIAADTTGSVVVTSTANSAASIFLHANGGTSETIRLHADQGTAVTSLDLLSDVGGITLRAGLGNADAINITATNASGGIDVDAGTAGVIVDTTGAISLDSAAASNFTVTGAFDLSVISTAGSVNVTAGEDAADAIVLSAGAGGIDILATGAAGQDIDIVNTGGSVNISATENNSGALTIGTNGGTSEAITVTCAQGTGVASIALTSTAGGLTFTGGLGTADAINLAANTAGGGIDIDSSTGGFIVDTTGAISLDSALASNLTVTGAADLTVNSTAGALNLTSGEANADSILITSAGGAQITATGAAAKDVLITCTSGSMTLQADESVIDAMNITAGGAAGGINLTSGTNGILFSSGQKVKVTSYAATSGTPYTVLGTDFFLALDVTGGVLTVTLPASPATGRYLIVSDSVGQSGANAITIDGNGKNISLAGTAAGTKTIVTAYKAVGLIYNGTIWNGFALA